MPFLRKPYVHHFDVGFAECRTHFHSSSMVDSKESMPWRIDSATPISFECWLIALLCMCSVAANFSATLYER